MLVNVMSSETLKYQCRSNKNIKCCIEIFSKKIKNKGKHTKLFKSTINKFEKYNNYYGTKYTKKIFVDIGYYSFQYFQKSKIKLTFENNS